MTRRHGDPAAPQLPPTDSRDPYIYLVDADMHTWLMANPCECEGLCECDQVDEDDS